MGGETLAHKECMVSVYAGFGAEGYIDFPAVYEMNIPDVDFIIPKNYFLRSVYDFTRHCSAYSGVSARKHFVVKTAPRSQIIVDEWTKEVQIHKNENAVRETDMGIWPC